MKTLPALLLLLSLSTAAAEGIAVTPQALRPVVMVLAERPAVLNLAQAGLGLPTEGRLALRLELLRELAVRTQAPVLELLSAAAARDEAADVRPLLMLNAVGALVSPAVRRELAALPGVERVVESYTADDLLCGTAADPEIVWNITLVDAPPVWEEPYGYTGDGVVVAVVDDGCDITHPDLADHAWVNPGEIPDNGLDDDGNGFIDDINGWDFFYSDNTILGPEAGHGSHVAGTVAGDGSGGTLTGMAPDARIMAVKAFADDGRGTEYITWHAMDYAVEMGARVMNLSFGWRQWQTENQTLWREECETLTALGCLVVAAAGNEGDVLDEHPVPENVRTPADCPGVLAVGATDETDLVPEWSSRGPAAWDYAPPYDDWPYPPGLVKPDIAAPGDMIESLEGLTGGYCLKTGTSMSTPHLTGAAALLLQAGPDLTPEELIDYLEGAALDLGESGKDNDSGSGRLQALLALVQMLSGLRFDSFSAESATGGVLLAWSVTRPDLVGEYDLQRRSGGGDWEALNALPLTGGRFLDRGAVWGTTYDYRVTASLLAGGSLTKGPLTMEYGAELSRPLPDLGHPYPSPADSLVNIPLELPLATELRLTLYDLAGRRLSTVWNGSLAAGRHTFDLSTAEYPSGVYLLLLEESGRRLVQPLVITH